MPDPTVVLVTGGAGYIGSHACKALAAQGYRPVVVDNLVYGHREFVRWGPLIEAEIDDREAMDAVFDEHRPAAVIHFAAYAYVGESVENPLKYYRNNVAGSLGLLEAMRDHQVRNIVFSSTCATYGIPDAVPIVETTPQNPINPYGATKLMVERMLQDLDRGGEMRSIALRYFNAAGADADGQIGESHDPETHLIPLALDAAAGTGPELTVFGDDYRTPDGTCIRDYIHVTDLAEAHVLALRHLLDGGASGAFNLGTGSGVSVREVIDAVARITGRRVPYGMGPRRPGDPDALVSDPSLAARELGWSALCSDIDNIVATAWAWHQRTSAAATA